MRILVTGATGQVGWYLGELLVDAGHTVLGVGSPGSTRPLPAGVAPARGACTKDDLPALLGDNGALDAVAHLGAPTHIPTSWDKPFETFDVIAARTADLAYRLAKDHPTVRLVHASSSNVFGRAAAAVLDESTPIAPASPYGVAKAGAQVAVTNAREGFGLRASNLVFFQALSPRAAPTLVLRKIARGVAAVLRGEAKTVKLGTLGVVRDVMHARDFAEAAKLLTTADVPAGDYCCASGRGRSIGEMAETVSRLAGLDPAAVIEHDPAYARPNDIPSLIGDASKLRALGWAPSVTFEQLAKECLEHELDVTAPRR